MEQTHGAFLKPLSLCPLPYNYLDFSPEDFALHRLPLVRVRRTTPLRIPQRAAYPFVLATRPRPHLDHAGQHHVDRERPLVVAMLRHRINDFTPNSDRL